jgi:flagellin-like hook-associated protein FlgL
LGDLHTGDTLKVGITKTITTTILSHYEAVDFDNSTWGEAKNDAESRGGYLATVSSIEEWDKILQVSPMNDPRYMWLGATDENSPGVWEWITGEPWSFELWATGEPNDTGTCLHKLSDSGLWNDTYDYARYLNSGYILERDVTETTETESHLSLINLPWSDLHATIMQVAQARAQNGAEQMRLQMAADLNSANIVNMEQALSRIQDVDIAQTASDLARTKVLIDAGTAMSAQANASQQSILRLIDSGRF